MIHSSFVHCPRCKKVSDKLVKMKQVKRKGGFHKQTKFSCSECGLVRMKANQKKGRSKHIDR